MPFGGGAHKVSLFFKLKLISFQISKRYYYKLVLTHFILLILILPAQLFILSGTVRIFLLLP